MKRKGIRRYQLRERKEKIRRKGRTSYNLRDRMKRDDEETRKNSIQSMRENEERE